MYKKSGEFWVVIHLGKKTIVKIAGNPDFFYIWGDTYPYALTCATRWIKQIKI